MTLGPVHVDVLFSPGCVPAPVPAPVCLCVCLCVIINPTTVLCVCVSPHLPRPYQREAEEANGWLRERMATATSDDVGKDQEACELLLAKLETFRQETEAHRGERVAAVADRAAALLTELGGGGGGDVTATRLRRVGELRDSLLTAWDALVQAMAAREVRLDEAHVVHSFQREADETRQALAERRAVVLAAAEDLGRDVASVEALQRKHEGFARGLAALQLSVDDVQGRAARLQAEHPGHAATVSPRPSPLSPLPHHYHPHNLPPPVPSSRCPWVPAGRLLSMM